MMMSWNEQTHARFQRPGSDCRGVPDMDPGGAATSARTNAGANSHRNSGLTGGVACVASASPASQCSSTRISDEHDEAAAAVECDCGGRR